MRSIILRRIVLLLLLCLCLVQVAMPVRADFENTYVNTGDQRADLIGVALTQVGYREGSGGYTKYGDWYGAPYTDWCGMFVSWCANQAGIPTSVLKRNGFASASAFNIPSFSIGDKTPRAGDLFFKTDGSHTGIVYYVEGDYFFTLEGNTDEYSYNGVGVFIRKRSLYDNYYFGEPPYQSDEGHNYQKGTEAQHPHKEYYQCTDCDNMYYTGTNGTVEDCLQCVMEQCDHQYADWRPLDEGSHMGTCGKCTKEELFDHQWQQSQVLKAATCEDTGLAEEQCGVCGQLRQVELPQTDDHQYGDWIYIDEESHYRVCQTCGRERTEAHSQDDWQWDRFEHFYECTDCGEKVGAEAHDHEGDCEAACTVCSYTRPTGHLYSAKWCADEQAHWYECANCPATTDAQNHAFAEECDESCDVCGYIRQTEHSFSEEWEHDATAHWHQCQVCGKAQQRTGHTPGDAATEQQGQSCTVCGAELRARLVHVHSYNYVSDDATHWGSCLCGDTMEPEGHIWDLNTGACKTCQAELPAEEKPVQIPWLLVLPALAAVCSVSAVVMGITVRKKKKQLQPA